MKYWQRVKGCISSCLCKRVSYDNNIVHFIILLVSSSYFNVKGLQIVDPDTREPEPASDQAGMLGVWHQSKHLGEGLYRGEARLQYYQINFRENFINSFDNFVCPCQLCAVKAGSPGQFLSPLIQRRHKYRIQCSDVTQAGQGLPHK